MSHSFETPWTATHQASMFFTISWELLKLMSIEWVMLWINIIKFCMDIYLYNWRKESLHELEFSVSWIMVNTLANLYVYKVQPSNGLLDCRNRLGLEIKRGIRFICKLWISVMRFYRCITNVKAKVKSLSRVQLFATPWTVAYQAPPSMGFSRQECWSGLPM